ncbi:molybdate ABC transporter substrate-binding protein [Candidatus Poriferisodalis sp.]|uniref:molybdate ABC transporter substrate-binding protein n=1 Tax=Candidatus Poriferisodalis sp. TaxID=3101277 RepID=UPI003B01C016
MALTVVLLSAVGASAVGVLAAGCAQVRANSQTNPASGGALSGELHVLVAASLLPVAEVLADGFETAHPGLKVQVVAAGSAALREHVLAGAPADVFIPADPMHLETVQDHVGLAHGPVIVARNSLVLAVPARNDAGVAALADLARRELLIGLCAAEVPCGALARRGLTQAGIQPAPDTEEPNVRALVTKLAAGELDAAVVYASDARPADNRAIVSLGWTAGTAPEATYAAGVPSDAPHLAGAEAFVAYLQSEAAHRAFADFGFAAP